MDALKESTVVGSVTNSFLPGLYSTTKNNTSGENNVQNDASTHNNNNNINDNGHNDDKDDHDTEITQTLRIYNKDDIAEAVLGNCVYARRGKKSQKTREYLNNSPTEELQHLAIGCKYGSTCNLTQRFHSAQTEHHDIQEVKQYLIRCHRRMERALFFSANAMGELIRGEHTKHGWERFDRIMHEYEKEGSFTVRAPKHTSLVEKLDNAEIEWVEISVGTIEFQLKPNHFFHGKNPTAIDPKVAYPLVDQIGRRDTTNSGWEVEDGSDETKDETEDETTRFSIATPNGGLLQQSAQPLTSSSQQISPMTNMNNGKFGVRQVLFQTIDMLDSAKTSSYKDVSSF